MEPIVEGLLKRRDVMVLAAPPKQGKSSAVLDLGASLIAGDRWFEYQCLPCDDVLYLNLENPEDEQEQRVRSTLAVHGLDVRASGLHVLNLKGDKASWDFDALWSRIRLFSRVRRIDFFDCIIIDPIYQLIDGDENSNRAMAEFFGEIGELCGEYDAALVMTHHFIKAWRSIKDHADRIAGAGTISRSPEVIATLTPAKSGCVELNVTARRHDCQDVSGRLYRIEGARFVECEQSVDAVEDVDPIEVTTRAAFDELSAAGPVRLQDLADKLGKHRATISERVKKYGFTIAGGVVSPPVVGG